jgi:hypothetical protein
MLAESVEVSGSFRQGHPPLPNDRLHNRKGKVVIIKTRRYKRGSFFAPETDMIFGDGVGASLEPEEKRARHLDHTRHEFFKHVKSGIVHSCATGQLVSQCKFTMSSNYKKLERRLFVNYPKCLGCFPNRIRNVSQLTKSLDAF